MSTFQPQGSTARWRLIYDLLRGREPGDTITYEEMGEVLSLHPVTQRQTIQMAMRRAAYEFLHKDLKALETVTNVGYRVAAVAHRPGLVRGFNRRAGNALERAHATATKIDLSGVDMQTRRVLEGMALLAARQQEINRMMHLRQERMERAVQALHADHERSEAETQRLLGELNKRLEQVESKLDESA